MRTFRCHGVIHQPRIRFRFRESRSHVRSKQRGSRGKDAFVGSDCEVTANQSDVTQWRGIPRIAWDLFFGTFRGTKSWQRIHKVLQHTHKQLLGQRMQEPQTPTTTHTRASSFGIFPRGTTSSTRGGRCQAAAACADKQCAISCEDSRSSKRQAEMISSHNEVLAE
jgi:hypothetical protein